MKYFSLLLLFFALTAQGDVTTVAKVIGETEAGAAETYNLIIPGASDSGLTYSSSLIEFTEGSAKLKNQFASDVVWAATYATTINATYSKMGGSLTGTATGTATITSGKLVMTGGGAARIDYNPNNNWPIDNIAAVRAQFTPDYTGSPATAQRLFYSGTSTLGDTGRCDVVHLSNGNLALNVHDANGGVTSLPYGAWSPTSGTEYEILAEMNYTTGDHRIFVDGVKLGEDTLDTGSRHWGAAIMRVGVDFDETGVPDFKIRNLVIYNATQETADYTPGYTVPTTVYSLTDPTIKNTTQVSATAYVSFDAGVTVSGSDLIKYQIEVGGTAKYWNGSAWANSDGTYAQSNTAADVNTNVPTLAAGSTRVIAVLHSADGSTTPALTYAQLVYE